MYRNDSHSNSGMNALPVPGDAAAPVYGVMMLDEGAVAGKLGAATRFLALTGLVTRTAAGVRFSTSSTNSPLDFVLLLGVCLWMPV